MKYLGLSGTERFIRHIKETKESVEKANVGLKEIVSKMPTNFGGIICFTLGSTLKTETIEEIIQTLTDILENKQHYILTIYDTVEDRFFGDCEVVQEFNGSVAIISNYISTTLSAYTLYYAFNKETKKYTRNKYSISIASKGSVTSIEKEIETIKSRLDVLEA